ncbi:putative bifunctional diguanylate cyclase/phosphodiesterase [Tumebacillus permanentifrigoris]|uniref:Diguanylate cyclase (GGDEF)-like protein n=1 Tax=Tumebacillus permanentifrigoris TaxID=378543 RepID=A0A316DBX7_9BACL|nr:EAL domain-containing protein [Tumebacillus permanentifrigoris]PWK15701.1 diguanylate cyclase (GGDEF)-like protein [Tumebacillus permanentifrigoris]
MFGQSATPMKRRMLTSQIVKRIGIALSFVGFLTIVTTLYYFSTGMEEQLNADVSSTKEVIANAMESTNDSTKVAEHLIDLQLLTASKAIAKELQGKTIDQVTRLELEQIRDEWGLNGISLFVKDATDIKVAKSSELSEIGLSSKSWGDWFTAFSQLMNGQPVTVEKGYNDLHFWSAPLSKADWNEHYYKYAYYDDGTLPFMINPYLMDQDILYLEFKSGPSKMIERIVEQNVNIEEISVLNVPAFLKGDKNHVSLPGTDLPVLYGNHSMKLPEDYATLEDLSRDKMEQRVNFELDGRSLQKFYIPLSDDRAMVIVTNTDRQHLLELRYLGLLTLAFLLSYVVIYFVVRAIASRLLQPLFEIEAFVEKVSAGDLNGHLEIEEENSLGWMAENINNMTVKMRHLIAEVEDRSQRQIAHMTYHDDLTSLPNRKHFTNVLHQALNMAQITESNIGVMFLDLDRFKNVNDSLGHATGDRLLREVARRLLGALAENHLLARMGGDEFAMLVPDLESPEEAAKLAQRALELFEQPLLFENREFLITASIGISVYPQDGLDAETLLRNADTAMYSAKENGRNNFQFYTPEMNEIILEQLEMEKAMRHALEHEEFVLHYQPQVDLVTGQIIGSEALIRWMHPERGLVPPSQFIPLAESVGLIIPLGEWVLRTACLQNKEWQDAGFPPIKVAVNLSARQFEQANLVDTVADILEESGLDPQYLHLEITETLAMNNANLAIDKLHALKNLGVQLSIDDFGTGYSSLNYLKKFPIDTLKIDRSFVGDIPADSDDAAIVTAIIAMAHNLKLTVVAEGVETEAQLEFLREQNCDAMQGFLFSRPVPAHQLAQLLYEKKSLDTETYQHLPSSN